MDQRKGEMRTGILRKMKRRPNHELQKGMIGMKVYLLLAPFQIKMVYSHNSCSCVMEFQNFR